MRWNDLFYLSYCLLEKTVIFFLRVVWTCKKRTRWYILFVMSWISLSWITISPCEKTSNFIFVEKSFFGRKLSANLYLNKFLLLPFILVCDIIANFFAVHLSSKSMFTFYLQEVIKVIQLSDFRSYLYSVQIQLFIFFAVSLVISNRSFLFFKLFVSVCKIIMSGFLGIEGFHILPCCA